MWSDVTLVQEVSKELEEEVFANRQRLEHMSRSHDQQLKELQQVLPPLWFSFLLSFADAPVQTASQREAELLQR